MLPDLREYFLTSLDTRSHVQRLLGKPDEERTNDTKSYLIYAAFASANASEMRPRIAFEVNATDQVKRIAVYFQRTHDAPSKPDYVRAFDKDWKPEGYDLN